MYLKDALIQGALIYIAPPVTSHRSDSNRMGIDRASDHMSP